MGLFFMKSASIWIMRVMRFIGTMVSLKWMIVVIHTIVWFRWMIVRAPWFGWGG